MKKIITLLLALLTVLTLAGCGSKPQEGGNEPAEDKTITVGVNPVPHAEILENAVKPAGICRLLSMKTTSFQTRTWWPVNWMPTTSRL